MENDNGGFVGNFFESLPEGFVANALALTSPRDVCRLSLVCSVFRSAAEWDAVWEKFLPPEYQQIMAEAEGEGGGGLIMAGSKKEMYLNLCDHPVIIDGGIKSFSLDKQTGKKCYMLAARDLYIVWGDTPEYWTWTSIPESRFTEVAELKSVCWLEVHGTINTSMLSTDTRYAAYFVYKLTSNNYGVESADVSVGITGLEHVTETVFLNPEALQRQIYENYHRARGRRTGMFNQLTRLVNNPPPVSAAPLNGPKRRQDGWLEIELGEYFNENGEEFPLEMRMRELDGINWKGGLIIQGIEIRPKAS